MSDLLRHPNLNGWRLFWISATVICGAAMLETLRVDISSPEGISHMIGYSVRWSVPFIYLVVAASAMPKAFPGSFSFWWARNRKYLGLLFAVAMAWQGAFIFVISNAFRDHYYGDVYVFRDELEGSIGYIFLLFMVLTSFRFGRRWTNPQQWRLLHTAGIHFLWAYPFSVYWWNLYYYGDARVLDYVYYWAGFLAYAVRILAWGKGRSALAPPAQAQRFVGLATILLGIVIAASGQLWQAAATGWLTGSSLSAELALWLPFWPFEPFLSLVVIALGTLILTKSSAANGSNAPAEIAEAPR